METLPQPPKLSVSDKLSIINALMKQDREEIRERQEAVFRLTYLVVPGLVAIAAFCTQDPGLKTISLYALIYIVAIYLVSFFTFQKWLKDSRACQHIRESFFRQPELLYQDDFQPIRAIREDDMTHRFKDRALWLPFGITVTSAIILLMYILTLE